MDTYAVCAAVVVSAFTAIFLPMLLVYTWRDYRSGGSLPFNIALAAFGILGAALFVPMFWLMIP
jgi:hypothetical protein